MTLARTPYARLSPADIGQVDRELKKLEQMSAGLYVPKVLVAARSPYTVQGTDTMLLCDCTAGPITLTFPLAARVDGMAVVVIKSDTTTNAVTLTGTFSGVVNPTITVAHDAFTVVAMSGAYHLTALVLYPLQAWETNVVDLRYTYGDVRRYGAACDGVTDDHTAVQAAVTSLENTNYRREVYFPPAKCLVGSTINITAIGFRFRGDASGVFSGVQSGSTLVFSGTGDMIQLAENKQRTILSITRAANIVTVTYATMNPGFENGTTVTIAGCTDSSFNGSFALTSGSFSANTSVTFAQVGANATSSGGTMTSNFDNAEYDDTASFFAVEDMVLTTAAASQTTPLLNGFANYAAGTTAIRDWRNGSVQLQNVEISHFETGFWGICSDINQWTFLFVRYNHVGFYLGPRSDQFVLNGLWSKFNDTIFVLDGCYQPRINGWQSDSDGSATTAPVQILGSWGRGTGGVTFGEGWFENYSGTGVYRAFVELGIGSPHPVRDIVFENPGVFTHAGPTTPRTQYLVSMDNADGVYIHGIHDRPDSTTLAIDGVVEFRGSTSPSRVLIEKGTQSITTPVVLSGTGTPVYTVSDPAGQREIVSDGSSASLAQLTLRSSADRTSRTAIASFKDATNGTTLRLDPIPTSGTADSLIELFRSVTTTGVRQVLIRKGDGSGTSALTFDVASGMTLSNTADVDYGLTLDSGSTVSKNAIVTFKDRGAGQWAAGKNPSNQFIIFDSVANTTRVKIFPSAGMTISPGAGGQQLSISDNAGSTTTASIIYDTGAATFNGGVKAGSAGTLITQTKVYTPSLTPASVAAASAAEQTFTVTGLTTADKVTVNPPAPANNIAIGGVRVSAADTLAIQFVNPTAGALTPVAGTYTVLALRS